MLRQQLAEATGVDAETIRYYERIGLLPAPQRRANGYRDYSEQHLARLAFIRHCRALDLPLETVARLLARLDDPVGDCGDVDGLVAEQLARVRARLASMMALEQQLQRLQARCEGPHDGSTPCGILQELVHAAAGEACACHPGGIGIRAIAPARAAHAHIHTHGELSPALADQGGAAAANATGAGTAAATAPQGEARAGAGASRSSTASRAARGSSARRRTSA
jgi:DNA-binding transcriptional MerR regulator